MEDVCFPTVLHPPHDSTSNGWRPSFFFLGIKQWSILCAKVPKVVCESDLVDIPVIQLKCSSENKPINCEGQLRRVYHAGLVCLVCCSSGEPFCFRGLWLFGFTSSITSPVTVASQKLLVILLLKLISHKWSLRRQSPSSPHPLVLCDWPRQDERVNWLNSKGGGGWG